MTLSKRDANHVFQRLRDGLVPERGLDTFAVGIEKQRGEIHRLLDAVGDGEGIVKFLRGGYGCGKTFLAQLATIDARARGFATSFVVVSDNDLRFHRFDDVYRKVVTELATDTCPRGALGDILDRWVANVEDMLIDAGADEGGEDFDAKVQKRLAEELASITRGAAPPDFVRVVQKIFELKQQSAFSEAGALISWLSGSGNVAAGAKKVAEIRSDIQSTDALAYLRGIVAIIKAAGYKGLVIVIDETETIARIRSDVRAKCLNGLRQIVDAASTYQGLLWLFTGTPEFFDGRRGVASLPPLHDRIRFMEENGYASLRQAQLQLKPFDEGRLRDVALRLREHFPATAPERVTKKVTDDVVETLVADVTRGFHGDVGVVPRQFLRAFVHKLDLVDENPEYDPAGSRDFKPVDLTPEEQAALERRALNDADEDDAGIIPVEDVW